MRVRVYRGLGLGVRVCGWGVQGIGVKGLGFRALKGFCEKVSLKVSRSVLEG